MILLVNILGSWLEILVSTYRLSVRWGSEDPEATRETKGGRR